MILILSTSLDHSTAKVTDWILYYGEKFIRLDGNKFRDGEIPFRVDINSKGTKFNIGDISLDQIKSTWFRRWVVYNDSFSDVIDSFERVNKNDLANIKKNLTAEMRKSYGPFFRFLDRTNNIKSLPKFSSAAVDKLTVLEMAREVGLDIPDTIICNNLESLKKFAKCHKQLISKPLSEVIHFKKGEDQMYHVKTVIVEPEFIDQLDNSFFPSLFQENIEKEIEVRSFYLEGKFYSMAIFSQLDEKTKVDFRNYNKEKPNRNVPIKLPEELEEKLGQLMNKLDLNTGSIDLILDKRDRFYFLEVNPVGQFGMTSFPCNYYLEKKIAQSLSQQA